MCEISDALRVAKAALLARPRSVVALDELNYVHADFNPYEKEIALIDGALRDMEVLNEGIWALAVQLAHEQQNGTASAEVIS